MIKALATDLDGTLFYPKRKLRLLKSKNRKFLKKLLASKTEIVLVTGRNKSIAKKIERRIKSKERISMVGCSGSLVIHKGEIIREKPMDKDRIKKLLLEFDKEPQIKSVVFMGNFRGMLIDNTHVPSIFLPFVYVALKCQGAYYEHSRFGRKRILEMLDDPESKVYKVMPLFATSEHSKKGYQKAKEFSIKAREEFKGSFEFFESGTAVEILADGVNKAESLRELFRKYDIKDDEVIVVGDSGNDIPMLEEFPNSFVMSQAPDYVKSHAKHEIQYVYQLDEYMETK